MTIPAITSLGVSTGLRIQLSAFMIVRGESEQ
jgi:hypothetical protein